MLEEAFGKAKNLLASAMYYPYRMIVASSVWVLPSRIFACWGIPQICSFGQATRFVNADKKFYRKRKITFEGFSDCFLFNFGFSDQRKVCNAMVWVRRYADGRVACFTTPISGAPIGKQKNSPTRDL